MRISLGLCFALLACSPAPPIEFAAYQSAFQRADAATDSFLARWSPYERALRGPTSDDRFDPDDAPFITGAALPGAAGYIDRGFAAVGSYNEVLARYAAGDSFASVKPAISAFSTQVGLLATAVGAPEAAPVLAAATVGLEAVAGALLSVSDRQEFRRAVLDNSGTVGGFLDQLRDATPTIYSAGWTDINLRRGRLLRFGVAPGAPELAALDEEARRWRLALAEWVLLIDDLKAATDALEKAVIASDGTVSTIEDLRFWTGEITRRADSLKSATDGLIAAF